ncbi:MAG: SurA N-terminal domain-containing protein [Pseudomonadota bacterium]
MLNWLLKAARSWVAKGFLLVLVASLVIFGVGGGITFNQNTAVAVVGDAEITVADYDRALRRLQQDISQRQRRGMTMEELRASGQADALLSAMMREAAQEAEMAAIGVDVPDEVVAETIATLPQFVGQGGRFSPNLYRQALASAGLQPAEFEALQRAEMNRTLLQNALAGPGTLPPGLAARIAQAQAARRVIDTVILMPDMAPDPGTPDAGTLSAYLEDNAARFRIPERKYGRLLHLSSRALAASYTPDPEAVRAFYEAQIDNYVTPGRAVVDQLNFADMAAAEAALASGASFEDMVADSGQSLADVALGAVTRNDLASAVADAVFVTQQPGIVGPVELPVGAALVRVREIQPERQVPFEEVEENLTLIVAEREALTRTPELAAQIEEQRAAGATLEEIAAALPATAVTPIDGWAADGSLAGGVPDEGITARRDLRAEMLDVLDGEEREVIALSDGSYALVVIDRIEPARAPALDEVQERVAAAWAADQRRAALVARAERIRTAIAEKPGVTLTSMAAGLGRPVDRVGPFGRGDARAMGLPDTVVDGLLSLDLGGTAQVPLGEAVMIVEVVEVPAPDPVEMLQMASQVEQSLRLSQTRDQIEYFVNALEIEHSSGVDSVALQQLFTQYGHGGY